MEQHVVQPQEQCTRACRHPTTIGKLQDPALRPIRKALTTTPLLSSSAVFSHHPFDKILLKSYKPHMLR